MNGQPSSRFFRISPVAYRAKTTSALNGSFWVLQSGAPWRDLPSCYGPYTTCYNRFVRWRRAGVWGRIMEAFAAAHDATIQMIDTSIVRVHQPAACIARNKRQSMGRSRAGLTSKIHAVVDSSGLPVRLALTTGEAHDNRLAAKLLSRLKSGSMLVADRGYDADWKPRIPSIFERPGNCGPCHHHQHE